MVNGSDPSAAHAVSPRRTVLKRDGQTIQDFDDEKIIRAVNGAWRDTGAEPDHAKVRSITTFVMNTLPEDRIDVESIQDAVEVALMRHKLYAQAKAYILYRQKRAEARQARQAPDQDAIANYIHYSKYARHNEALGRREVYEETVRRVEDMHKRRFPTLLEMVEKAFKFVYDKRVLPSMRSMQFGGAAIEANNSRVYNCSFTFVDRPRAFAEALYLLLCGCGVGYSVQYEHVEKLPALGFVNRKNVVHHEVEDTIEGWADALNALVNSYIRGYYIEFSFSKIRPAGAPLKTSGGKAPGHLQLKDSLEAIRAVLHAAQGRKLRPIECHDIMCHAADAVLSGGIRRSAMICLFSLEDSEMVYAKTGDWYPKHPWRQNANNSVVLKRDEIKKKQFKRIFNMIREWGEPGFYFVSDYDYGTNPCGEIGLNPKLVVDETVLEMIERRHGKAFQVEVGETFTGWAFCNLCEINAAKFKTPEDFLEAAEAAATIGTLQAAYTSMPYLGWVSEVIAEREALLGIGMTGMLDSPAISLDPELQKKAAALVVETNKKVAAAIGIRPAARATCVKPSGTTSLELGSVANGHHAHHAKRYIRRVTADELETVFQAFREKNPHMCVRKPDGKWVIEFPVEAPEGALVKDDIDGMKFLEMVKSTQQNWVLPGTARPDSSPGLTHNVSNTVSVKPDEWDDVAEFLWANRAYFTGVTLLASTGDKDYAFAPQEAVVTEADEARWNQLISAYKPVDYTTVMEKDDATNLSGEAACAGGACAIV